MTVGPQKNLSRGPGGRRGEGGRRNCRSGGSNEEPLDRTQPEGSVGRSDKKERERRTERVVTPVQSERLLW